MELVLLWLGVCL